MGMKDAFKRMTDNAQRIGQSGITRGGDTKVTMFGNKVPKQRYGGRV
jgi:hypothetical protein